ncbi:hypothetical protein [Streptomyces sp. NPDC056468]|uniref:hypothetical protein n=1 Tax=Streptomyces sp. NPDC056468 TaxID=3345830 RepID=UPI003680AD78
MSSNEDAPQGITPDELETRLDVARAELLQHLTDTSSLSSLYESLLKTEQADGHSVRVASQVSHSMNARGVIAIRTLSLFLCDARRIADKLDRAFDLSAARRAGHAQVDKGILSQAALERNLTRARDRGVADVHARARDLNHALMPDICFTLDVLAPAYEHARVLLEVVNRVGKSGRGVDHLLDQALDRAASMAKDLIKNLDHANHHANTLNSLYPGQPWPRLSELGEAEVDASRADLTSVEIVGLRVLSNFIWSDETKWPHHLDRESLLENSVKVPDGMYAGMYIVQGERKEERINALQ